MLKGIRDKTYNGECRTTIAGTEYFCKTVGDDYLHILYAGLTSNEKKQLFKELKKLKKDGPRLNEYLSVLEEVNGAMLYAGSINLFGYASKRNEEDTPSLLIELNKYDQVSKMLNQVVYIGNMPCAEGGNINIYFNVNSGLVTGYYKGDIRITWTGLSDFFNKIISRYEKYYKPDGTNNKYGMNDETVYNNIQKYILKEN